MRFQNDEENRMCRDAANMPNLREGETYVVSAPSDTSQMFRVFDAETRQFICYAYRWRFHTA